ncbi:MAG: hypothetical protein HWE13_12700 [Gammaproteobacteria bacterium]|nr:hypothetical protein [Gammaproteobacteria bacterium]NVK88986.1 hypothetical protein [Gammaproteobacteria bacterium]
MNKAGALSVFLLAIVIAVAAYLRHDNQTEVYQFCQQTFVGMKAARLQQLALEHGLLLEHHSPHEVSIQVADPLPWVSSASCLIQLQDATVTMREFSR